MAWGEGGRVEAWVINPRYRLVVDESLALGVLGARGRGACEHWGLAPGEVEIVAASMGTPGWLPNSRENTKKTILQMQITPGAGRGRDRGGLHGCARLVQQLW